MKKHLRLLLVCIGLFASPVFSQNLVLEDAEDETTAGWSINDNSPVGAAIDNIDGVPSRYVQFTSSGTANRFLFGGIDSSSGGLVVEVRRSICDMAICSG